MPLSHAADPRSTPTIHLPHTTTTATATLFVCGYPSLYNHLSFVQPHFLIWILGPHDSTPRPTITGLPDLRQEIDDVHRPCNGFANASSTARSH